MALRLSLFLLLFLFRGLIQGECETKNFDLQREVKAIIFDCDGVLVDTEYLKFLSWQEGFKVIKVDFSLEDYLPLVGQSSKNILKAFLKDKKLFVSEEVCEAIIDCRNKEYDRLQQQGVPVFEVAVRFVKELLLERNPSEMKIALASSAPHREIAINLKTIDLENSFDQVLSGSDDLDSYEDSEGKNKPKPYIYLEAAKRLNVDPKNCLVFEDSEAGVKAALAAEMSVIAVPNRFTSKHDFTGCVGVIESFSDLHVSELLQEN